MTVDIGPSLDSFVLKSLNIDSETITEIKGPDIDLDFFLLSPLKFLGAAALSLLIAFITRKKARQLAISSIQEAQLLDPRNPVLFLRSFLDDHVKLRKPRLSLLGSLLNLFQTKASLDQLLLEEAITYGPVVALGNPNDLTPPFGASRGYFMNNDWYKGFSEIAKDSQFIIICLSETPGLLKEVQHILTRGYITKSLFLFHPNDKAKDKKEKLLKLVIDMIGDENMKNHMKQHLDNDESIIGYFFEGEDIRVGVSKDFSEVSYLVMIRWFLRTATNI